MFKKILFFLCFLTLFFLAGCERDPLPSKNFFIRTPQERYAQVAKLKYWQVLGVVSIQQAGEKPAIAEFYWNVMDRSYRVRLTSVLGLFRIEIYRAFGSVKLWKNSTLVYTAKTPEGLLQKTMGWTIPISHLQDWIKGMPAPQKKGLYYVEYDQFGHLIGLKQDGWGVQYSAYKKTEYGIDFPQIITMTRPGLSVKLVIREWTLLNNYLPMWEAT